MPPRNISDKFIITRDLCKFLQPRLISLTTIDKKLGFPTPNHKRMLKLLKDFDWKHILRTETSKKSLLKTFYYNNKDTKKVKDFQKLSNKKIYFILQSNSTKYNSLPNFLEGHHILSPQIWGKTFTDWLRKCSDGYIFSSPLIHRMGNDPNIQYLRCKKHFNFK